MVNAILNFLNQLTDVEKKENRILKNISLKKKTQTNQKTSFHTIRTIQNETKFLS